MKITRRGALGLAGGGIALAAAGGTWAVWPQSAPEMVRQALERSLGPLRIAEPDLEQFTTAFMAKRPWVLPGWKLAAASDVAAHIPLAERALERLAPEEAGQIDAFERLVLGDFFNMTDVGFRADPQDAVSFVGETACLNPFAQFDVA